MAASVGLHIINIIYYYLLLLLNLSVCGYNSINSTANRPYERRALSCLLLPLSESPSRVTSLILELQHTTN